MLIKNLDGRLIKRNIGRVRRLYDQADAISRAAALALSRPTLPSTFGTGKKSSSAARGGHFRCGFYAPVPARDALVLPAHVGMSASFSLRAIGTLSAIIVATIVMFLPVSPPYLLLSLSLPPSARSNTDSSFLQDRQAARR
ncbi:hypothetical protein B0H13DRAFT_2386366 [Mycena leptocephala]|nr:hypothetical protein B0H13DRAFT_2386366 [Mycena leptocephala]